MMGGQRFKIIAGLVLVAAIVSAMLGIGLSLGPADAEETGDPPTNDRSTVLPTESLPTESLPTELISKGELVETKEEVGTVDHGEAWPAPIEGDGIVTARHDKGTVVGFGDPLVWIDNKPITLVEGDTPLYRTLELVGTSTSKHLEGGDVRQLQRFLSNEGFDDSGRMEVDGIFGRSTRNSLKAWQKESGLEVTGRVDRTQMVFHPTELRVDAAPRIGARFPTPVLELREVERAYPGSPPVRAIDGVSLQVNEGELVAIVGPSGSGKSTLMNLIGTLDRPTSGTLLVDGVDTGELSDRALAGLRAARIGFVFQQFHLLAGMSATENVAGGLLYRGVSRSERRSRSALALERVGLGQRLDHTPNKLSGGERQRVAIARALVGDPAIVLADEPTGNLDSTTSTEIVELLHNLHREGSTILVITHDLDVAAEFPRRIAVRDGRIEHDTGRVEKLELAT